MPTVERIRGRGLVRGIGRFDTGDRADVSEDDAEYLVEENGDFRRVDSTAASDAADDSDSDASDPSDADDPESEAASLADEHWNAAVTAVEDGDADAYLDELEAADDRESVQAAIEDRRAELEG